MSFFATCVYLRRNLRAVWPPNASFYASSTCVRLRLLAGPFGQGFKFSSVHSCTNIPFLDVSILLNNDGSISTDHYTKPTDKHQHLLYSSCHSWHTKKSHFFQSSTPLTTYLFYRRFLFNIRASQVTAYLLNEASTVTCSSLNKYDAPLDIPRRLTLQPKTSTKPKRIPFITAFNLALPRVSSRIKKRYNLLLLLTAAKNVFSICLR